jgi:hypothetical protein
MNTTRTLSLSLVFAALIGNAVADGGLTREQVKADLAEARRSGSLNTGGEIGLPLNELYPRLYPNAFPARAAGPLKSRAQVQAELAEARRTGDIVVGESGLRLNEISPGRYPTVPQAAGKSRDEVRAELAEARLLGDMQLGEYSRTQAEINPQRYAAVRAQRAAQAQQMAAGRASKGSMAR